MEISAVVMAAGKSTRMKSKHSKVVFQVSGKPIIQWVADALFESGCQDQVYIVGEAQAEIRSVLGENVAYVLQEEQRGTGHAVMQAKDFLAQCGGNVVILNGDAPFMDSATIKDSFEYHIQNQNAVTVISARVKNPTGYGRIVRGENGEVTAIIEQKDADEKIQAIDEVNSGGFWFDTEKLLSVLDEIKSDNAAKEYYLPDALKLLLQKGEKVGAFTAESPDTVLGANDPQQLEELNQIARDKGYRC
jgi:bifunctional UDP-N-acetylglucosamine pyrophosphorylase/glucosamine-1-phosphate N-acetyltransferase